MISIDLLISMIDKTQVVVEFSVNGKKTTFLYFKIKYNLLDEENKNFDLIFSRVKNKLRLN